ncbi:MAG: hypothetical protein CVT49_13345 [candidate division Zixibacteria bacterium HGW-Zixibacteria-1]|nr:MAG: hypothetical protein CVT49_13345 [candidate division Zixibacteria bacterium HGW-Zixibacteria-1]
MSTKSGELHLPPQTIRGDYYIFKLETQTNIDSLIDVLNQDSTIRLAQPVFINEAGGEEAFTDRIVIKKAPWLTQEIYDSLLGYYNLLDVGGSRNRSDVRYVAVTPDAQATVLETANRLYGEDDILFSHPIFYGREYIKFEHPSDPLYQYQWYAYNPYVFEDEWGEEFPGKDIEAYKAWDITKGNPEITIAVLDDGITNHPDFPIDGLIDTLDLAGANRDIPSIDSNCNYGTCDSCGHGFAVSGIIISDHNQFGIAGIVPGCKLIFIKIVDDANRFLKEDDLADALLEAGRMGANIISNSWGNPFATYTDNIGDALNRLTNPNIEGLSCAIFFAAGNEGFNRVAWPARAPQVLAVGATDSIDIRWEYSEFDSTIDVMAPSGNVRHPAEGWPNAYLAGSIMTTDRPGDSGYTPFLYQTPYLPFCYSCGGEDLIFADSIGYDYTCNFGGTSAACPQVAGIAAMVMSRRPDLADSNYLIYDIIKYSAEDQVGPSYGIEADLPGFDQYYGWGRVNALRALLAVCRGDANNSGQIDMLDVTFIINYFYKGGPAPEPDIRLIDATCDGALNILDVLYIIYYLYDNGPAPQICFEYGD